MIRRSLALLLAAPLLLASCGEGTPRGGQGEALEAAPAAGAQASGLTPFQVQKAEALIRDRLPCLGCHVLDGEGGRIGPELSEVGARLSRARIDAVVRSPQTARAGSLMPRIPMPERWRSLVVDYLATRGEGAPVEPEGDAPAPTGGEVAGPEPPPRNVGPAAAADGAPGADPSPGPPMPEADGAALYGVWCAPCHGASGDGDGPNARFLPVTPTAHSDPEYMSARPDDSLFDAIWAGGRIMGRSHRMPPFGGTLSRTQIRALVAYMRELCDCVGPAWSRDGELGR